MEELHFGAAFERNCMKNDIVLVELKERVRFTEYIFPACVGGPVRSAGDVGVAIGWGVTESDVLSPVLRKAELPVIDSDDCRDSDPDFFGAMLHKGMFCAGHRNGTSVCNGDSGGGLFFQRDNVWFVRGLVSFSKVRSDGSNLCVAEGYAGFTDVAWYANWIHNVTGITSDTVVKERQVTLPSKPARISERSMKNNILKISKPTIIFFRMSKVSNESSKYAQVGHYQTSAKGPPLFGNIGNREIPTNH